MQTNKNLLVLEGDQADVTHPLPSTKQSAPGFVIYDNALYMKTSKLEQRLDVTVHFYRKQPAYVIQKVA